MVLLAQHYYNKLI